MKAFANYAPINIKPGGGGAGRLRDVIVTVVFFFALVM